MPGRPIAWVVLLCSRNLTIWSNFNLRDNVHSQCQELFQGHLACIVLLRNAWVLMAGGDDDTRIHLKHLECCKKHHQLNNQKDITVLLLRSARTSCRTFNFPVHPSRAKNLDHLYTGIHALWIIRSLIKPTRWNKGIPKMPPCPSGTLWAYPLTTWDPVGLPLDPLGPCRSTPWPPGNL